MLPYERYEKILGLVAERGFVTVAELLKAFDCSMPTIQRDLSFLESEKRILRTRGGLTTADNPFVNSRRSLYKNRQQVSQAAKQAIGRAAQPLIGENDVIFISHGTTTFQIASQIPSHLALTVVTDGLDIVAALENHPQARVILIGGVVDYEMHHVKLPLDLSFLESLNFTKVLIGAAGVSIEGGVSFYSLDYVEFFRKVLRDRHQLIVAVDHTKIGYDAAGRFADLSRVNVLVTDRQAGRAFLAACRKLGIQCLVGS